MKRKIALLILCICVICFIWGNSVLSPEASSAFSSSVGEMLAELIGEGDATQTVGGISVRKLGHFAEFFALGSIIVLLLAVWVKELYVRYSVATFLGLLVPVIDETIQLFSGRGSSLRDVWIDVGGYVVGASLVCTVFFVIGKVKKRGKNNNKI